MKHLAIIQGEFLKIAKWDDLSYEAQAEYLNNHPDSLRRMTKRKGERGKSKINRFEDVPEDIGLTKEKYSVPNKPIDRSKLIPTGTKDSNGNLIYQNDTVGVKFDEKLLKAKVIGDDFKFEDGHRKAINDVPQQHVIRYTDWLVENFCQESQNNNVKRFNEIHPNVLPTKEKLIEASNEYMLPRTALGLFIMNDAHLLTAWGRTQQKYKLKYDDDENWKKAELEFINRLPPKKAEELFNNYKDLLSIKDSKRLAEVASKNEKLQKFIQVLPELVPESLIRGTVNAAVTFVVSSHNPIATLGAGVAGAASNFLGGLYKHLNNKRKEASMKHLATIQTEFLKEASKWNDLTVDQQWAYLRDHPHSKKKLTAKPRAGEGRDKNKDDVIEMNGNVYKVTDPTQGGRGVKQNKDGTWSKKSQPLFGLTNARLLINESSAEKKVRKLIESGKEDADNYEVLIKREKNKELYNLIEKIWDGDVSFEEVTEDLTDDELKLIQNTITKNSKIFKKGVPFPEDNKQYAKLVKIDEGAKLIQKIIEEWD